MAWGHDDQAGSAGDHQPGPARRSALGHRRAPTGPTPRPEAAPSSRLVEMLGGVLADLTYPAQVWQIMVAAEYYGADSVTAAQLRRLPPATYRSLDDIARALILAARDVPRAPGRPDAGRPPRPVT